MHPTLQSLISLRHLLETVDGLLTCNGLKNEVTSHEIHAAKAISVKRGGITFWFEIDLEGPEVLVECYVYPSNDEDPHDRRFGVASSDNGKTWCRLDGPGTKTAYAADQAGRRLGALRWEVEHAAIESDGVLRSEYSAGPEQFGEVVIAKIVYALARLEPTT